MAEATKTLTRWGKLKAKSKDGNNKNLQSHSTIWTEEVQPNNKWVDSLEKKPEEISDSYKAGRNKNSTTPSELTMEHLQRPSSKTSPT